MKTFEYKYFQTEIGTSGFIYDINLSLINSKSDMKRWVEQLRGKNWCTDAIIKRFKKECLIELNRRIK